MSQKVLAVVAGKEITEAEVDAFIHSLPREQQAYASNPQFQQQCLDQVIAIYAYAQMGEDLKLDETEEFIRIMENAKKDVLAQMAMAEILKKVEVSDEEVKAYYEANSRKFAKGETVRAKHILVSEEDTCNSILESIVNGEKEFEDAAKEYSTCPSGQKGGDLGEFGRGQMVKEFEDAAFAAEIGHVVGPVKTQFGYHLIKVEEKHEATAAPLEEVKDQIRKQIMQQKQNEAYSEKLAELKEKYLEK
ncbi:peptidylprolyl isomerase [Bariatricus sp. SGI.161]|uniref:peptidylprolyl isomerase n=1 Tax=Lachnospiraceae TaxID=186803 RepID=UPI003D0288F1